MNERTHFKGNEFKGATINSNPETERIIAQANSQNNINFDTTDLQRGQAKTNKLLRRMAVNNITRDRAISEAYKNQYL